MSRSTTPTKSTFRADRQDHDERVRAEDLLHLGDDAVEIRTDPVELVDVNDAGDFRVVGVAPVGFRLRLNAAGTAEHADAAVENLERTVNFDGEVHVARGVDDVELVILPEAGGGGGLDGDAALGFLFHEVHRRCAIVNFPDLVDLAGELENTFGGGRFARINVGENADVAVFAEVLHNRMVASGWRPTVSRRGQIPSRGSNFGNPRVGRVGFFVRAWKSTSSRYVDAAGIGIFVFLSPRAPLPPEERTATKTTPPRVEPRHGSERPTKIEFPPTSISAGFFFVCVEEVIRCDTGIPACSWRCWGW